MTYIDARDEVAITIDVPPAAVTREVTIIVTGTAETAGPLRMVAVEAGGQSGCFMFVLEATLVYLPAIQR